ncbi:MAG TPA: fibronectin type III domain-containing protein [Tepidisphaeraceae bacterium]|jgi:regulation of enolase protein 1 (concanavalin A-like superfamily)
MRGAGHKWNPVKVESLEKRFLLFGSAHQQITKEALGFMVDTVLGTVLDQHYYQDTVNYDVAAAHFDGCYFQEGASMINSNYQTALSYANPSSFNTKESARYFGRILHPAQDFYSHSNWIEQGHKDLLENGTGLWDPLTPYSIHSGAVFIEGETLAPNVPGYGTATLTRVDHIVTASFADGRKLPAIITGNWTQEKSPDNIEMHHDQLNKDTVDEPGYYQAYPVALEQTKHEFTRLGALIQAKYGQAGIDALLKNWVKSDTASQNQAKALLGATTPTPTPTAPAAPDSLVASATGSSSIQLSWRDNSGNEDGFDIERSLNGTTWTPLTTVTANTISYVDQGLSASTKYYYHVRARNSAGTSAFTTTASATTQAAPVAGAWQDGDVGAVATKGSYALSNGVFTVKGSGANIGGNADAFHFVYQTWSGDGQITARVTSVQSTDDAAMAGVMWRDSLAAGAKAGYAVMTPLKGIMFQRRYALNGTTTRTQVTGYKAPYWLKVVRSGSTLTAYRSADGASWMSLGSDTVTLGASVYVGLAVCSRVSALNTSTFDNVSVTASTAARTALVTIAPTTSALKLDDAAAKDVLV